MIIVGAGMAGLLAANMLRSSNIIESQPQLPNNHSAVLRFRSSLVGDVLGIPFRKVNMMKTVLPWRNAVADSLAYSFKNTKMWRSDRSVNAGTVFEERYIAPTNLIERMAEHSSITLNKDGNEILKDPDWPVISTIPMPVLMKILDYQHDVTFNYIHGTNIRARIRDCDAYASILVPDPARAFTRLSIAADELIIECPKNDIKEEEEDLILADACFILGIKTTALYDVEVYQQRYAKINPIDDDARKAFMYWATTEHNVYSLGRFATWRPGLLLDDLVKDVRKIDGWVSGSSKYDVAKAR